MTKRETRNAKLLIGPALGAVITGALGALLAIHAGPRTAALLFLLTLAAGLWFTWEVTGREARALSSTGRRRILALRSTAWLLLLIMIARPGCDRTVTAWEAPLLAVLLDSSQSMALVDPGPEARGASRAERVAAVLRDARPFVRQLGERFDLRLWRVGERPAAVQTWEIAPAAALTDLVAGLEVARDLRSARSGPAAGVLLISDGADNVSGSAAVRRIADDLAQQNTPLLAVAVGPPPGRMPLIELEPLSVPQRVGPHDLLHVSATGRIQGCGWHSVLVEAYWDDEPVAQTTIRIEADDQPLDAAFDVLPPGIGPHRLLVRAALPPELGGQTIERSTVVDVVGDRIRVLLLEQTPRTETAFLARALRGDPAYEVTEHFLYEGAPSAVRPDLWAGCDVVVLGRIRTRLPAQVLAALADAVATRGAGLLIPADLLASSTPDTAPLVQLSPVLPFAAPARPAEEVRFAPTPAGLQHSVLRIAPPSLTPTTARAAPAAADTAAWAALPPLAATPLTGRLKPAAVTLATDSQIRPLLVAHEVGRGRCLAAAWESTWPWALASDAGHDLHSRFWRQLVAWLANRRPRAWVITDLPTYSAAAVRAHRRIAVRAGLTGAGAIPAAERGRLRATLALRRIADGGVPGEASPVPVAPAGAVAWTADLSAGNPPGWEPTPGDYLLELTIAGAPTETGGPTTATGRDARTQTPVSDALSLTATGRFSVVAENLESRPPTANLSLLRTAAERTATCGGSYRDLDQLPDLLQTLTAHDQRRRIERRVRFQPVEETPGWIMTGLVAVVTAEWFLRKRHGLA
ncbi:MAG: hypothetical protein AB1716_09005 [Planctomycetota bacterium]